MSNSRKWTTDQYEAAHCRIGKVTLKRQVSSRRSMPFNETLNRLRRAISIEKGRVG